MEVRKIKQVKDDNFLPVSFIVESPPRFTYPSALYIVDLGELFTENLTYGEINTILTELNILIDDFEYVYVRFYKEDEDLEKLLKNIEKHIGKDNKIAQFLMEQEDAEINIIEFLEECKKNKVDTLYLGGVYGSACVFEAASRCAENIYSRIIPDMHPNVRFWPTEYYRFKTAVILDKITEGHSLCTIDKPLPKYVCFPCVSSYSVEMGDDILYASSFGEKVARIQKDNKLAGYNYQVYSPEGKVIKSSYNKIWTEIFAASQLEECKERFDHMRPSAVAHIGLKPRNVQHGGVDIPLVVKEEKLFVDDVTQGHKDLYEMLGNISSTEICASKATLFSKKRKTHGDEASHEMTQNEVKPVKIK